MDPDGDVPENQVSAERVSLEPRRRERQEHGPPLAAVPPPVGGGSRPTATRHCARRSPQLQPDGGQGGPCRTPEDGDPPREQSLPPHGQGRVLAADVPALPWSFHIHMHSLRTCTKPPSHATSRLAVP